MTNSADPDQLASSETNWSGSTLFAKAGHVVFSKRRVQLATGMEKRLKTAGQSPLLNSVGLYQSALGTDRHASALFA